MAAVRYWVHLLAVYVVAAFWGTMLVLNSVRLAITKRKKFFTLKRRDVMPSCLKDPDFGSHGYATIKGLKIHYVSSGPTEKPLMLMLHGFPEFWYSWRHQIKEFNKEYRVVAADLRGYGASDKPGGVENYRIDHLVEDIHGLIPALGYKSCILVGHDWGGAISWMFTAKYPEMVEKCVVLNCPHPAAMQRTIRTSFKQFMMSWYMFALQPPYLPELFFASGDLKMLENAFTGRNMGAKRGTFSKDDMEAFKYTFSSPWTFTAPMNYIRAALRPDPRTLTPGGQPKQPTRLGDTPVLLIWGTRDGALSKPMAELSGRYAKQFRLQYIEGASHWVQQEEPELVNKYMREFIESTGSD